MVLPAEPAAAHNRPPAPNEDVRKQWEHSGLRHAMLIGTWQRAADQRLRDWFDDETYEFLPDAVLAFNPGHSYWTQTATIYDDGVTVHRVGDEAEELGEAPELGLDLLWPKQRKTLVYVRAMNDALVLRSWDAARGRVRYVPVAPDCVHMEADPDDPTQPNYVEHYRQRSVPGYGPGKVWCRDTYDFRYREPSTRRGQPGRIVPYFHIHAWVRPLHEDGTSGEARWVDVTYAVMPELDPQGPPELDDDGNEIPRVLRPGQWMYWTDETEEAEPIWCWTAYHGEVGDELRDTWTGCELVDLTLIAAVLWTFWLAGFRDAAHSFRFAMDAEIAAKPGKDQPHVAWNPMMVMLFRSRSDVKSGSVAQLPAAFDVREAAEAICNFMAAGALFIGLSPADTSIGNAGLSRTSGYAIEVSRDGKRKIEKRMVKPMGIGDCHNLAGAAQLANAYAGTGYPTRPEDYRLVYSATPRTIEEARAEVDEVTRLVDAGLMDPVDAILRLEPHLTREQARAKAIDIAKFRAELEAIANGSSNRPDPDQVMGGIATVDALLAQLPAIEARAGTALPQGIREKLTTIRESMAGLVENAPAAPKIDVIGAVQHVLDTEGVPAPQGGQGAGPEVPEGAPLAATALNGAQVTSALEIVQAVVDERLPRSSAKAMLRAFFQLSETDAEAVLGEVGVTFVAKPKAEPPPFGGAPPKPADEEDDTEEPAEPA